MAAKSLPASGGGQGWPSERNAGTVWFRIQHAEHRVGQCRHLVMAFTPSNAASGCVTRR